MIKRIVFKAFLFDVTKEIEIIEAAWPIPAFAKKFTKIEGALLTSSQSKLESSHRRVEDVGAHVCKQ